MPWRITAGTVSLCIFVPYEVGVYSIFVVFMVYQVYVGFTVYTEPYEVGVCSIYVILMVYQVYVIREDSEAGQTIMQRAYRHNRQPSMKGQLSRSFSAPPIAPNKGIKVGPYSYLRR